MNKRKRKEIFNYLDYHDRYRAGSGIFRKNQMYRVFEEGIEITIFEGTGSFHEDYMKDCRDFLETVFQNEEIGIFCSKKSEELHHLKGVKAIPL